MKLITRDTDYAVRALCFIGKNKNKVVPVSQLVKELKVPRPFLRKILQVLNKRKILRSYKGMGGGFSLALPARKIYLMDLVTIFQGKFKLNECLMKRLPCANRETCVLKKKIDRLERYLIAQLKPVSIASLHKEGA